MQQGTTLEKNIAAAAPNAKVTAFKDYNSAWLALAQGRVDALTGSLNILQGFQKNNPNFKIVGDISASSLLGSAFARAIPFCAMSSMPRCAIFGPPANTRPSTANISVPTRPFRSRLGRERRDVGSPAP